VQLGGYHCNLAHILRRLRRPELALVEYAEAIRILEELWTDPELAPGYHRTTRTYLGNTYQGRLAALDQLGRNAEALSDEDRLLQIDPGRYGDSVAFTRALTLARLGLAGRATNEADTLTRRGKHTGLQCYLLAGCYAHLGKADRAVDMLGKARSAGYFAAPSAVNYLKGDKDFDALKARPEFQRFLAELTKQ
jgi:tetratricopeptide (TPR) repeat protein